MTGSWLCRDDMDRERLLDMERHLRPLRLLTMGLILASAFAGVGFEDRTIPLIVLAGVIVVGGLFWLADSRLNRSERPEYLMFAAWAGAELAIAVCVAITGGPDSPGVAWLAIPIVTLSARFSMRGVLVGVGLALALLIAATVAVDPAAAYRSPDLVVAPAVVILSVAMLSIALMRSDLQHRGEASVDQLTGMLNRKALADRAGELAEQSAVTGQPVGMIVGDLDRFKRINDSLGHATGDAVLKDVAYRLRKRMRAFDLAYRIGGEEFLILLPGAGSEETAALAEQLRKTVEGEALGGIGLTMSFGVSASARGERFDYERVFAAADAALYEAKRTGRNRVRVDGERASAAPAIAQPAPVPAS